jgi:hypothetical protein
MKGIFSNKIILITLYILLLAALFWIFVIVINSAKNPAYLPKITYLILFLSIIIISVLFFLALKQINTLESQVAIKVQETITETETKKAEEQIQEQPVVEFNIDIKNLIPKERTKIENFSEELLRNIARDFNIVQGLIYLKDPTDEVFNCLGQYAYYSESKPTAFKSGETLPGQAVKNKNIITISNIPDQYMTVASGLGKSSPRYLTFVPMKTKDDVVGIIEFASFSAITEPMQIALGQLADKAADVVVKFLKK